MVGNCSNTSLGCPPLFRQRSRWLWLRSRGSQTWGFWDFGRFPVIFRYQSHVLDMAWPYSANKNHVQTSANRPSPRRKGLMGGHEDQKKTQGMPQATEILAVKARPWLGQRRAMASPMLPAFRWRRAAKKTTGVRGGGEFLHAWDSHGISLKKGNYLLSALWCHKYFWKKDWWNLPNSCRGVRSWSCLFGDGQFLGRIFQRLLPVVSLPFPIFRSGGSNPFQWELRRNREKYWNLDPCRKRQFLNHPMCSESTT